MCTILNEKKSWLTKSKICVALILTHDAQKLLAFFVVEFIVYETIVSRAQRMKIVDPHI